MTQTVWYSVRCDDCMRTVLVCEHVARRVADGVSFVLCIPCANEYEAVTGHEAVGEYPAVFLEAS